MTENENLLASEPLTYVGFWARLCASIIDSILLMVVTLPLLFLFYGSEYFSLSGSGQASSDMFINYALPIIIVLLFWIYKSATPGKIAVTAIIVDEKSAGKPTKKQLFIRYLGYYISLLPLGLGFFWIAWDDKKQGWHDKIAGTVVIRSHR